MRLPLCKGTYFRSEAAVCVLSMMTGLGGGVNLGGSLLLLPDARRQRDVDKTPGNGKTMKHVRLS